MQTDVTDEGVQEAERRVGVVQLESSKVRDMDEEGMAVDEKEKSFCKLRMEKRRLFILVLVVAVDTGEPALRRASSCRSSSP